MDPGTTTLKEKKHMGQGRNKISTFILSKVVVTNKIIAHINKEHQRGYVGLSFGYVQHLNGNN